MDAGRSQRCKVARACCKIVAVLMCSPVKLPGGRGGGGACALVALWLCHCVDVPMHYHVNEIINGWQRHCKSYLSVSNKNGL